MEEKQWETQESKGKHVESKQKPWETKASNGNQQEAKGIKGKKGKH